MSSNRQLFHIGIFLLAFEKVVQHLLSALFFIVDISGIGRPDIGPNFQLSDGTMVVLNVIVGILFALGLWGRLRDKGWHRTLLIGMAIFDILAEFVFHGLFFITWSVIVAVLLLVLLYLDRDKSRKNSAFPASQR
jgi:hypothetical protein